MSLIKVRTPEKMFSELNSLETNTSNTKSSEEKTPKILHTVSSDVRFQGSRLISLVGPIGRHTISIDSPTFCFQCSVSFKNLIEAEAHFFLTRHSGEPNPQYWKQDNWVKCRRCGAELYFRARNEKHRCAPSLEADLFEIYSFVTEVASPLFCILCNVKSIKSRTELILHLIAFHSENVLSYSCSICHCLFRSNKPHVKEEHMMAEHAGDLEINFQRTYRIKEGKNLSLKEFINPLLCTFKIGKSKICGIKLKNLASFTIHVLCFHSPKAMSPFQFLKASIANKLNAKEIKCYKCELIFESVKILEEHIQLIHEPDFERQLDYHIRRNNFKVKHDPSNTCFLCSKVLADEIAKQVHTYVIHWSKSWRQCGLCHEQIISDSDLSRSDNLQYKIITVHEDLHVRSIKRFLTLKETNIELINDFKLSLIQVPKLYVGAYVPMKVIEEEEREKNVQRRMFPREVKLFFRNLGNKNKNFQETLELFG